MESRFELPEGNAPLIEYPWCSEIERLLVWAKSKDKNFHCFIFDLAISLAFIDATAGLGRYVQYCPNAPKPYNLHSGFINLCAVCYEAANRWTHQKAAKPLSGALGKISSEMILKFIEHTSENLVSVKSIGGVNSIDAILEHKNGDIILAEVKSAPLITFPILFNNINIDKVEFHKNPDLTNTQFVNLDSALYLHDSNILPLGKPKDDLWPFKNAVDYILAPKNKVKIDRFVRTWLQARNAYAKKDRKNSMYYLANASGQPPRVAKERDHWPGKKSISDGKTSVGMDRTDDIKKGIYQSLKISTLIKTLEDSEKYKTAIVSNLPAYRHGKEYVDPFVNILWGFDSDLKHIDQIEYIDRTDLRRIFDYIITIDNPLLREIEI